MLLFPALNAFCSSAVMPSASGLGLFSMPFKHECARVTVLKTKSFSPFFMPPPIRRIAEGH